MSQYPYQPPQVPLPYGGPMPDALAPARRAGTLLWVVAALTLLGAFCCAGMGAALPQMMRQQPELLERFEKNPGMTPQVIRTRLFGAAVITGVLGLVLGVMVPFVRRGRRGATILAIVVSSLVILYLLLSVIGTLLLGGGVPSALCSIALPVALFALLLASLISALRSSGAVQEMQQQYAQQYWQYAYQQQMYQQGMPPGATSGSFPPPPGLPPQSPPPQSLPPQTPPPQPPSSE